MARTKRNEAFSYKDASEIMDAMNSLRTRVLRTLKKKPTITYRELLQLIAPSEHIEILLNARQIGDIGIYTGTSTDTRVITSHRDRDVGVEFTVERDEKSPVMPRHPIWLDHFPENRGLVKELVSCAKQFADVAIEWDEVEQCFRYLNEVCKTPAQMRYLWPSIVGIMSASDGLGGLRASLAQFVVPKSLPTLPLEVRAMCKRTAAVVTMALMLPTLEHDSVPTPDVLISYMLMD